MGAVVPRLTRAADQAGVRARALALAAALLLSACAGPFNQVTPCVINCAVTLNGNPATAPQPSSVTVHRLPCRSTRRRPGPGA